MAGVGTGREVRYVVRKIDLGIAGLDGRRINRHPFSLSGFEPHYVGLAGSTLANALRMAFFQFSNRGHSISFDLTGGTSLL